MTNDAWIALELFLLAEFSYYSEPRTSFEAKGAFAPLIFEKKEKMKQEKEEERRGKKEKRN